MDLIAIEPFRIAMLTPQPGDICKNEHSQKFKLIISSQKLVTLEPYEGKRKATFFVYMGKLPDGE